MRYRLGHFSTQILGEQEARLGEVKYLIPTQNRSSTSHSPGKKKKLGEKLSLQEKKDLVLEMGDKEGDGDGTRYLGGGTLEFQQDEGAGALHNVEIKQVRFVPGVGKGRWKLSRLLNHPTY